VIVVKLGGRTQGDVALPGALAALWRSTSGRVVVVHGGGDQISAWQRLRGEEPVFIGGRRVTTPLAMELVRMVLSGLANKDLVAAIGAAGVAVVGVSGEDGGLLLAEPIDASVFGLAGAPSAVDPRVLHALLDAGFLPVVSPVAGRGGETPAAGEPQHRALNVNGDDAAAAIAVALGASELFFMADVPGVLDERRERIPALSPDGARDIVESGVAGGGMAAKLDAGLRALDGGVTRVRIGDLAALVVADAGTHITSTPSVRQ